jgi:hypothetical protein
VDELTHVNTGGSDALREAVAAAQERLADQPLDREAALAVLARVGNELDGMADRIRTAGRRIYPPTLHGGGVAAALEEIAVDLPRPVQWTGDLGVGLDWEIEFGIYCAAAAALRIMAAHPSEAELLVALERTGGRAAVQVIDSSPTVPLKTLRASLAVNAERLAALGGRLELTGTGTDAGRWAGRLILVAWLPDRVEPPVAADVDPEARRV